MPLDHINWRAQTAQLIAALEKLLGGGSGGVTGVVTFKPGDVFRDAPDAPEMVVIPAGKFLMGSPESEKGRYDDEGPQHWVTIAQPFALGRFAVTVAEFGRFVAASGYKTEAEREPDKGIATYDGAAQWVWTKGKNWRDPGFPQDQRHPVAGISWNDARAYVERMGKTTGKGYRLPSEAEWEYAARAGTTTARFWGDDPSKASAYANVADLALKRHYPNRQWAIHDCDDGFVHTAPVGSFKPNAFGLYDVIGNVREWTADCWNENYKNAPDDRRPWETGDCRRRVVRGGSWINVPDDARSAGRSWVDSDFRNDGVGFRLARTL